MFNPSLHHTFSVLPNTLGFHGQGDQQRCLQSGTGPCFVSLIWWIYFCEPCLQPKASRRTFRSNMKEQKHLKAKFTFSVNRKPIILFKMDPRTKINYQPVNYTPQSDSRIQQSLDILQNIAKTNLQIATAISHFFNNHQPALCHFPHVQSSTKDRSHDLPQPMSHTPVSHALPYQHVKPNSRHLTPDTLHQPLSPPTPQVQNHDPESADPPLSAVWSLRRFCRSSQEHVDHPPAGDRSRSLLFSRQVPTGPFYESTTGPLTNQARSPARPDSREAEDCSRHEYTEDHLRSIRGTDDSDTNCPPKITDSEIPRSVCRNSVKDHITNSADPSSSSDNDIPDLQSSSTDSEGEKPLR